MASLQPELITEVAGFPVTNTIIATVAVDAILLFLLYVIAKQISVRPSGIQSFVEPGLTYFYGLTEQIAGSRATKIFPWFATFFIVIFVTNLFGLLPGITAVGIFEEHHGEHTLVPLFRAATTDFNMTLALGTVSVFATHLLTINTLGFVGYLKKFLSFNPVNLFIGLLEFVLEFVKIISLSFRLFGNIFAGEVVLVTISGIFAFLAPLPFIMLETIIALVQALVFAMLTMVFMAVLSTSHSEGGGH